jgi:hypothetical protein
MYCVSCAAITLARTNSIKYATGCSTAGAIATEARQTNRRDELVGLASEVGLDIAAFIQRLDDGSARKEFEEDLRIARKYHIRAFPSFRLSYKHEYMMLHGYQSYEALKALIENTTEGAIAEGPVQKSEQAVLEFINQFESVAPVEIKTAFDLTDKEVDCLVNPLFDQEKIRKV